MLINKFLNNVAVPFSRRKQPKPAANPTDQQPPELSSVLRIVHAGGMVEYYYMAIPAVKILEKYPSYVLAKPEVFRKPWDTVVRPEKILIPGQKFFLVPIHTVRKLRRKIKRPAPTSKDHTSFISGEDNYSSVDDHYGSLIRIKKHVTFVGINNDKKKAKIKRNAKHYRRPQNALVTWQPSLTSVTE